MKKLLTPTLALILAGGLAAGIALSRPASQAAEPIPTTAAAEPGFLNAPPAEDAATSAAAIDIADFGFGTPIAVAPGQVVTVTNRDGAPHTLTSDDGLFDTGDISGGGQATFVAPTTPGTYTFFCAIHPSMQGELVVQG